jgi:hypothetical protein
MSGLKMTIKTHKRIDPGHEGTMIDVNYHHINFFSGYRPKGAKTVDESKTAMVFSNGVVMLMDVPLAQVRQTFKSMK